MKAMILAAGRGERMRPLTDATAKPLLVVRGKPLIEWHLVALARAGVREVVVNTAWRDEDIAAALGDGNRFGLAIRYSREGRDYGGALDIAGGLATALPLLADHPDDPFWLVSGDIYAPRFDFDAGRGAAARFVADPALLAHLWLVPNPPFHPRGDFGLDAEGFAVAEPGAGADPAVDSRPDAGAADDHRVAVRRTFASLALCRAGLCAGIAPGTRAALLPSLQAGMRERRITAEPYDGRWENVGTPAQLAALNRET